MHVIRDNERPMALPVVTNRYAVSIHLLLMATSLPAFSCSSYTWADTLRPKSRLSCVRFS